MSSQDSSSRENSSQEYTLGVIPQIIYNKGKHILVHSTSPFEYQLLSKAELDSEKYSFIKHTGTLDISSPKDFIALKSTEPIKVIVHTLSKQRTNVVNESNQISNSFQVSSNTLIWILVIICILFILSKNK